MGDKNILVPIEQLRILFEARKVVVSGAVWRPGGGGILDMHERDLFNTGSAREYRVTGVHGKDYAVDDDEELSSAHRSQSAVVSHADFARIRSDPSDPQNRVFRRL